MKKNICIGIMILCIMYMFISNYVPNISFMSKDKPETYHAYVIYDICYPNDTVRYVNNFECKKLKSDNSEFYTSLQYKDNYYSIVIYPGKDNVFESSISPIRIISSYKL